MIDEKLDDQLDKRDWVVFAEGTELTVDVPSKQTVLNYHFESTLDWEVKTDAEWLEIDPMSGKAGKDIKIQIKVLHNKDKEGRTGYADLTLSNDESYRITINQAGVGDENENIVVDIPHNQIWYTSTDGEIVEPYSGEENNYADALTTFGANIVSNTYDDEKECWVIKFDCDVTTIGYHAFYGCSSFESITIPDSVTSIGFDAFSLCSSLESITIPNSVTSIGFDAFYECSSLTSVYISDISAWCNISFGRWFYNPFNLYLNNELVTDLTIPDSVTTIGDWAFGFCSSLTSVTIPDSVTTIGEWAFAYCSSLISVTIGDSVTTIGGAAFADCWSLTSVTIPDSVTTIGGGAFFSCTSLTSIIIPDSVTTIGECAFEGCSSLTSVTIPDSVTTIGLAAFETCSSLASVTVGDSVTTIGNYAFQGCSSLESITIPDSVTTIGEWAFAYCSSLISVTIGDSVTTIGNIAFWNCWSLASVTIGDSVTTIGGAAFADCWSLTSVTIPDSVTTIGGGAFSGCSSLTSITIPDSVTEIGDAAFAGCSSLQEFNGKFASEDGRCLIIYGTLNSFAPAGLTEYTIPDRVTTIGWYAFTWCESLTSVYCKATTPPVALLNDGYWYAFEQNAPGRKIYVPMGSVEVYKSAKGWSDYADDIVGYNF